MRACTDLGSDQRGKLAMCCRIASSYSRASTLSGLSFRSLTLRHISLRISMLCAAMSRNDVSVNVGVLCDGGISFMLT